MARTLLRWQSQPQMCWRFRRRSGTQSEAQVLNQPGSWDVMLSYTQCNAGANKLLAAEIYSSLRERGKTVWLDIKMEQLREEAGTRTRPTSLEG